MAKKLAKHDFDSTTIDKLLSVQAVIDALCTEKIQTMTIKQRRLMHDAIDKLQAGKEALDDFRESFLSRL